MDFLDILGAWCFGLSLIFTVPQAVRVIRRNTVEGISVTSQLQGVAGSIMWIVYGLVSGAPVVAAA
ncbi:MAG: loop repeat, partial [Actinomycetota bacterium]